MNFILHYLLLPIKPLLIWIVALIQRYRWNRRFKYIEPDESYPDMDRLEAEYKSLQKYLRLQVIGDQTTLETNPDHQVIRHASLLWALPDDSLIKGLGLFLSPLKRGISSGRPPVPSTPISIAFGITAGKYHRHVIPSDIKRNFNAMVWRLVKTEFDLSDSNLRPRAMSNGFDAIYAMGIIRCAERLGLDRFDAYVEKIMFHRGYAWLLLAPLTWLRERNAFIDHLAMISLWTWYQNTDDRLEIWLIRHCMRFIYKAYEKATQPYYAALMAQCGALDSKQKSLVLRAHAMADLLGMSSNDIVTGIQGLFPMDWSNQRDPEFGLDDRPKGRVCSERAKARIYITPLAGISLYKSIRQINLTV